MAVSTTVGLCPGAERSAAPLEAYVRSLDSESYGICSECQASCAAIEGIPKPDSGDSSNVCPHQVPRSLANFLWVL